MMLRDNTAKYAVTHQLLYFIVLEHMGCKKSGYHKDDEITTVQRKFCTKIYKEAKASVKRRNVPRSGRDLFLEQTMLCGSLGFEDFMKEEWITMVLQWPDKNEGCFKLNKIDFVTIAEESTKNFARNKNLKNTQIINFLKDDIRVEAMRQYYDFKMEGFARSRAAMRKPLREQSMKDGCLSHTTGLGIGVFGIYLRYLLRLI